MPKPMPELPHTSKADMEQARIDDLEDSGVHVLDLKKRLAEHGNEEALKTSLARIDELTLSVETSEEEEVREKLIGTMQALEQLGRSLPANDPAWDMVSERYKKLLAIKGKSGKEVSQTFSQVFDQFNDFIEDEFVTRAMQEKQAAGKGKGQSVNVGALMKEVYGRTQKEMEEIKRANRERVVALIDELKEKPYVQFDDIRQLHEANNRGVAPKSQSRMRMGDEDMVFGKAGRIGTRPEDLPAELGAFEARVENVIDQASIGSLSQAQYEIAVAQLHNEGLDMHPFNDRNGSTFLLFAELMMARRGHEPSKERESNYYKALTKTLGYNPVAVAMVGYEQFKIGFVPGYFKGVQTSQKEKEKEYNLAMKAVARMRRAA